MKKFLPKGFTLIELMVVITIIAILSLVGLVIYSSVQKNARDTKRKGDIAAIATALEANYTSGSTTPYPIPTTGMFASGAIPTDPQTAATYTGIPTAAAATYTVCATLEGTTGNATSNAGAGLGTVTNGGFYCRKNAQ